MEMRKLILGLLLFILCGCENHIGEKMYVIGIGLDRKESNTLYLAIVDGSNKDEEFRIISEQGNSIDDIINNLEKKYNASIEFKNTSFILSNTYNKTWIVDIIEDVSIDYDCKYSYSDSIKEVFALDSPTLVDDIIRSIAKEQTIINFLNNNWQEHQIIHSDGKEVYADELKRITK